MKSLLKRVLNFCSKKGLANASDDSDLDPLKHAYELAINRGLFERNFYEAHNGKFANGLEAFKDYLAKGSFSNVNPSSRFDSESYLRMNPDIYHSGQNPLVHYMYHGIEENRRIVPAHLRWHPKDAIIAKEQDGWQNQSIAIVLHIFYDDFVKKFADCLDSFPVGIDVYVAVPTEKLKLKVESLYADIRNINQLKVVATPNRGRNFGPLLVEFGRQLMGYDLICHAHSKKSLYSGREQTQWFDYLNQYLLKDRHVISCLLRIFHQNPNLGMYYPTSFWMMPNWVNHWTCNKPFAAGFVNEWGLDLSKNFINYPVGGMFWLRPKAINQLLQKPYSYDDFPEEPLPNDGSWLHALERTLGLLVEKNEYKQFYYNPATAKFTTDGSYIFANYHKSPETLFEELRNFNTISFDVFDTILRREYTEPDYAKLTVGKILSDRNVVPSAEAFVLLRNKTERELREEKNFKGDVNIFEIYQRLVSKLDCNSSEINSLIQLEFECDLALIQPKDEMVELVYKLSDLGREIWFITDTYYTQQQIEIILKKIGVTLNCRLFVSSELGLRKDTGAMWLRIKERIERKQTSYIHVGDNVRSDAQICGDYGLANMHILHPIDKWQAIGFEPKLIPSFLLNESEILKWGKLISNTGRYPFFGE
jgi:FMN phosphatase YigB (HAD superfamily)